jgi:predicted nucleic acid-binding protein
MFRQQLRPKLADTLIAQSCLDHGVPLVTRDRGFSSFQKFAGLRVLAIGDLLQ